MDPSPQSSGSPGPRVPAEGVRGVTRSRFAPYLTALLGVALVTAVRLPFEGWLAGRSPYVIYYLPILFVAWRSDLGPTIATLVLSLLAANFFFVPERYSFELAPGEGPAMALFALSAVAMAILSRGASLLRERSLRNERACRRAEQSARAAVWDWNADSGTFEAVALAGLFGVGRSTRALTTGELEEVVHPDDRALFREGLARARDSAEPVRVEFRIPHPTQGVRWIAITGERSAQGTDGRWVSGVAIDITAHRQAEAAAAAQREWFEQDRATAARERERLLDSERAARGEAERANRVKDEFVATLSHELRTPLNAILGWVRVLQKTPADEKTMHQALDVIDRQTQLQAQLISDLLDMSRILAGKMRLEVQAVDLGEILDAALETARPALEARRIELRKVVEPVPRIAADPARMQQVLWNLLSNAVKFTPEGGRVTVTVRSRDGHAEIAVGDTGKGIHPDFLGHVFERFRQGEGTTSRRFGGLGLGLAIVKQLVELHGGSVAATSDGEGHGAMFVVRLPVGAEGMPHPGRPDTEEHGQRIAAAASPRLKKLRVLVVEDENDSRELVVRILQECGADVAAAASGAEALALAEARPPDLLISDIGMPLMDGYTLIQRIRQSANPRMARAPAIALTAFARPEDRTHALRSGFQAHLAKPMEPAELVATVASFADLLDLKRVDSGA